MTDNTEITRYVLKHIFLYSQGGCSHLQPHQKRLRAEAYNMLHQMLTGLFCSNRSTHNISDQQRTYTHKTLDKGIHFVLKAQSFTVETVRGASFKKYSALLWNYVSFVKLCFGFSSYFEDTFIICVRHRMHNKCTVLFQKLVVCLICFPCELLYLQLFILYTQL